QRRWVDRCASARFRPCRRHVSLDSGRAFGQAGQRTRNRIPVSPPLTKGPGRPATGRCSLVSGIAVFRPPSYSVVIASAERYYLNHASQRVEEPTEPISEVYHVRSSSWG